MANTAMPTEKVTLVHVETGVHYAMWNPDARHALSVGGYVTLEQHEAMQADPAEPAEAPKGKAK